MRSKDGFLSLVKGFIAGLGALIPNISICSIIASFSSYEPFIKSCNNSFKFKDKTLFLIALPLIIGIIIALFVGEPLIKYFLVNYESQTIFLFIGLIVGGCRIIAKKEVKKNNKFLLFMFFISFFGFLFLCYFIKTVRLIDLSVLLKSIVFAVLFIFILLIPGISVNTFNISDDKYYNLVSYIKEIFANFDICFLMLFIGSFVLGSVIIVKLIFYFLQKNRLCFFVIVLALLLSNVVMLLFEIENFTFSFVNIFTSFILFLWGYFFSKNLENE